MDDLSEENQQGITRKTEEEIWLEFQAGSDSAFEMIYRRNGERLFYYGMKIVRDEDLVWDTIQDLFIELWNTKSRLGTVKFIKPYLFKILRRKLIRSASKQRKILHIVDNDNTGGLPNQSFEENSYEEKEHRNDVEGKLKQALSKLSRKQQEVIYLRFYDGLSTKEIAKITGIKKRTVNHHLSYALKLLKKIGGNLFLVLLLTPSFHKPHRCK